MIYQIIDSKSLLSLSRWPQINLVFYVKYRCQWGQMASKWIQMKFTELVIISFFSVRSNLAVEYQHDSVFILNETVILTFGFILPTFEVENESIHWFQISLRCKIDFCCCFWKSNVLSLDLIWQSKYFIQMQSDSQCDHI